MNCCEHNCNPCGKPKCGCDPCGEPLRVLSVEAMPDSPGVVKFNLDGHTQLFDFSEIVAETETDTFLRIDQTARLLKYLAEGHTNNITAKELGSIIHLGDLGDVDMGAVEQNSLLFYQKNSECGQGCDEITQQWIAWNATDNLSDDAQTLMGFSENDTPVAIQPPIHNTGQYYLLSWRAGDKAGYTQPVDVSVPTVDSNGKTRLLFENPNTKQIEALPVIVTIDGSGNVTFKTQGGA